MKGSTVLISPDPSADLGGPPLIKLANEKAPLGNKVSPPLHLFAKELRPLSDFSPDVIDLGCEVQEGVSYTDLLDNSYSGFCLQCLVAVGHGVSLPSLK